MANVLTGLIATLYSAMDVVSREPIGFIGAVTLDPSAERLAVGQTAKAPVTRVLAAEDGAATMDMTDGSGQTVDNTGITMTKWREVPLDWTGEEALSLSAGGTIDVVLRDDFAQAFRTLSNEVEADLAGLYTSASRAHGTAGTTPFASTLADTAQVRKILMDNGAPLSDLQMVLNTTAGANVRTLSQLTKANEAGTADLRSSGVLLDIHGFKLRESAQVKQHTKGTGSGYLVNNASNYAAGSTAIAVDTGTGTALAGDILTNSESGRDANKYVIGSALSAGSLALNKPGLITGWTNNDAVAIGNSYAANMAFARSAIRLATRTPAIPKVGGVAGDAAIDRMMMTDPVSGITFEIAVYAGKGKLQFRIGLVWGYACVKPEHCAILLG